MEERKRTGGQKVGGQGDGEGREGRREGREGGKGRGRWVNDRGLRQDTQWDSVRQTQF